MLRTLTVALAATGLSLLSLHPAVAADAAKEIATAGAHAGMAAASADLKMVHTHLHHVLNCLEGPGGKDFDAGQANPCKDQGMGAIPDAEASAKPQLEGAVVLAKSGLAESDLAKAKDHAAEVQAALKRVTM